MAKSESPMATSQPPIVKSQSPMNKRQSYTVTRQSSQVKGQVVTITTTISPNWPDPLTLGGARAAYVHVLLAWRNSQESESRGL